MSDRTPDRVTDANGRLLWARTPDGRSIVVVGEDGRLKTVPLRFAGATPTPLCPPHPGRLSARTLYNLAAVRSELESLIHYANAYRTLAEGGTVHGEHATPHAVAAMLRTHVAGLTRCYWALEGNADRDDVAVLDELGLAIPLSMAVDNFDIMAGRCSVMDFASAVSRVGIVGTYEYILRLLPAFPTDVQPPPGRTGPPLDALDLRLCPEFASKFQPHDAVFNSPPTLAPEPIPTPPPALPEPSKAKTRKRPGRRRAYEPALQRRVCDAWRSGLHASKADLATAFHLALDDVVRMIDNDRHCPAISDQSNGT